jgi:hypothetical protein
MKTPVRRCRMRRTRTGKRIELTARDLDIFRWLARYRYLPSTYIHAFVGGKSKTRFTERLGDFYHEGYIDRPGRQWDMSKCRHRPAIHEIDTGAKRILDEQSIAEEPRTWFGTSPHRQFSHSLMVCELLASIELGIRARPGLRFIPWPEICAKAPPATRALVTPMRFPSALRAGGVMPDGLFGIEYADGDTSTYRFFALEADRGTMPVARSNSDQTSYIGKLAAYRDVIVRHVYKTHLGIPNLLVLTVTTSNHRVREIWRCMEEQGGSSAAFLFKTLGEPELKSPTPQLLLEPWHRCGLSSVRVDRQDECAAS